jgi:hypothetical protein
MPNSLSINSPQDRTLACDIKNKNQQSANQKIKNLKHSKNNLKKKAIIYIIYFIADLFPT